MSVQTPFIQISLFVIYINYPSHMILYSLVNIQPKEYVLCDSVIYFFCLTTTRLSWRSVSWVTWAECAALPRYEGQVLRGQRLKFLVNVTSRKWMFVDLSIKLLFLLLAEVKFFRGFCWKQKLGILFHIWVEVLTWLALSQDKSWLKTLSRLQWKCSPAHKGMRGRYYGNKGYMFSGFLPA